MPAHFGPVVPIIFDNRLGGPRRNPTIFDSQRNQGFENRHFKKTQPSTLKLKTGGKPSRNPENYEWLEFYESEFEGLMDNLDYAAGAQHKLKIYPTSGHFFRTWSASAKKIVTGSFKKKVSTGHAGFRIACQLRKIGTSFEEAISILLAWAEKNQPANGNTLAQWQWRGDGPGHIKVGGAVRYLQSDLIACLSDQRRQHTGEPGRDTLWSIQFGLIWLLSPKKNWYTR